MLTYGRLVPFLELFARIDAVDATTIKEIVREFIIEKARMLFFSYYVSFYEMEKMHFIDI